MLCPPPSSLFYLFMHLRFIFPLFFALCFFDVHAVDIGTVSEPELQDRQTVRLGVMSFEGTQGFTTHIADEDALLAMVPNWLSRQMPHVRFETKYYRMNDLMRAVKNKKVDVFLGSSGLFWQMKQAGARDLATIVSNQNPDPNEGVAGVIFVKKSREDLKSLEDLRGLRASSGLPNMFLATQLAFASIAQAGYDPDRFFESVVRHDLPYPHVIEDVMSGRSDVGVLRACVLESEWPEWEKDLKVISPKVDNAFHCARSTEAYPNWTMAAVSGFNPELSRAIAVALLTMPPTENGGYHWSLATEFERVDTVSRLLKTDSYSYLKEWTIGRIWSSYREVWLLLIVLIIGFLIHVHRVEKMVVRRTQELREEMQRREETEKSLHRFEQRLELARKMSIVGEMSSIFAHEIRQPLASIQYLTDAIAVLTQRRQFDDEKLQRCTQAISSEVDRINRVVDRVRSYAKEEQNRNTRINFSTLVSRVLTQLRTRNPRYDIIETIIEDCYIYGDELELELAVANLLKNARDAAGENGVIRIELDRETKFAVLTIENSGEVLSEEEFEKISLPLQSNKSTGLGLGIPIVRSIVEMHRGQCRFARLPQGGIRVTLLFPLVF